MKEQRPLYYIDHAEIFGCNSLLLVENGSIECFTIFPVFQKYDFGEYAFSLLVKDGFYNWQEDS